jgi:hypothetical protein
MILAGDLNAVEGSAPMNLLLEDWGPQNSASRFSRFP